MTDTTKKILQESINKDPLSIKETLEEELKNRISLVLEKKINGHDDDDDDEELDDDDDDDDGDDDDEDDDDEDDDDEELDEGIQDKKAEAAVRAIIADGMPKRKAIEKYGVSAKKVDALLKKVEKSNV